MTDLAIYLEFLFLIVVGVLCRGCDSISLLSSSTNSNLFFPPILKDPLQRRALAGEKRTIHLPRTSACRPHCHSGGVRNSRSLCRPCPYWSDPAAGGPDWGRGSRAGSRSDAWPVLALCPAVRTYAISCVGLFLAVARRLLLADQTISVHSVAWLRCAGLLQPLVNSRSYTVYLHADFSIAPILFLLQYLKKKDARHIDENKKNTSTHPDTNTRSK